MIDDSSATDRTTKETNTTAGDRLNAAVRLVNQQAEDGGLWFQAATAGEAYLQQELRKLHAAIEGTDYFGNPLHYHS